MGIKFKIGKLVVMTTDKSADEVESELETRIEKLGTQVESGVLRWVRNDRIFDGLRNTYARVLLALLTVSTLYGFGFYLFTHDGLELQYIFALLCVGLMNKLSVRFVFDLDDDQLDEYQLARRDRAYRGAYKSLARLVTVGVALFFALVIYVTIREQGHIHLPDFRSTAWLGMYAQFSVPLNFSQLLCFCTFAIAFFNLQKYLSWGFKGEPFRSKNEPND